MFYYMYQITNEVNGKIYVGVHKTKDMNDGYMGSGKIIRSAIAKHGITNFSKVILETFDNAEAMYAAEKELVTDEFLARDDVYNLRRGGFGGFDLINKSGGQGYRLNAVLSNEKRVKGGYIANDIQRQKRIGIYSEGYKSPFCNREIQQLGNTQAAREKAKKTAKVTYETNGHQRGNKNSQFGKVWVSHSAVGSKKCHANALPDMIEQGWIKGRNIYKTIAGWDSPTPVS